MRFSRIDIIFMEGNTHSPHVWLDGCLDMVVNNVICIVGVGVVPLWAKCLPHILYHVKLVLHEGTSS